MTKYIALIARSNILILVIFWSNINLIIYIYILIYNWEFFYIKNILKNFIYLFFYWKKLSLATKHRNKITSEGLKGIYCERKLSCSGKL